MSRADRLEALVEEALDALDDGDLDAARAACARARKLDRTAPSVRLLEGALADADGEPARAIAIFDEVAAAHPDDPIPHLHAGNTYLYSLDDPKAAADAAARALERCEEEDELLESILLRARALTAMGERHHAAAREALAELDSSAVDDPDAIDGIADAALAAGDPAAARRWWQKNLDDADFAADAWYGTGLACDALGDVAGRTRAWLETRRRDLAAPRPDTAVTTDQLEGIAAAALAELPAEARARLANVPVLIDDAPSEELIADGVDPRLLGLFSGTPMPAESAVGGAPSLTTIHLFQRNLEATAADADELREQIRITVLHETAHFFGLDEDDLEDLGLD